MLANTVTLKLDSSFKPIEIVSWQDAITLVITGKAYIVEAYEKFIRSAKRAWKVPAVIALKRFVKYEFIGFACNRKNVLLRDNYVCQYCGRLFDVSYLTLDHVIPKSRGGINSWSNLVTACLNCNQRKGNRLSAEIDMYPLKVPRSPNKNFFIKKFHKKIGHEIKKYV